MSCPRCRDTGHVVDYDGNVSECPEECCLKQRAVDALGVVHEGRRIFKGGEMKVSVKIKGFELTPDQEAGMRAIIEEDLREKEED